MAVKKLQTGETGIALRPKIKAASAGAPYLTGVMDAVQLTRTYPYEEIH